MTGYCRCCTPTTCQDLAPCRSRVRRCSTNVFWNVSVICSFQSAQRSSSRPGLTNQAEGKQWPACETNRPEVSRLTYNSHVPLPPNREPHALPPSDNPAHYSQVSPERFPLPLCFPTHLQQCGVCGDKAATLLLCSSCRMTVCMQESSDNASGCLRFDRAVENENVPFVCHHCCRKDGVEFPVSHSGRYRTSSAERATSISGRRDPGRSA